MFVYILWLFFALTPMISWADGFVSVHQTQGFESYAESSWGAKFTCKKQCFIILDGMKQSQYIQLIGEISGSGRIWYGYINGQQIIPGAFTQIPGTKIDQIFEFTKNPYFWQIPKDMPVVIFMEWDISANNFSEKMGNFSFFESFSRWWNEALSFKEYNPRTINFLEWPLWNGKYINEVFFWWIIAFLCIAVLWSFFERVFNSKTQRWLYFWVGILAFFWVFFDFFSSVNEYRIYKQTTSAKYIMENGRVGRTSDFYEFLEFIKTQVPKGAKWTFVAPYPFDFEGRYHIYPEVKFDDIKKVKYLFVYNPYGLEAPLGYKDPVISSGSLFYNSGSYIIEKEIPWKTGAKIYILK